MNIGTATRLKEYSLLFNRDNITQPSSHVIEALKSYHWPGNVRELQNILKRMLVLGDTKKILDELYSGSDSDSSATSNGLQQGADGFSHLLDLNGKDSPDKDSFSLKKIRKAAIDRIEREVISHVLEKTDWNRSKATKILKISYKTLLYKISDLDITPPEKFSE